AWSVRKETESAISDTPGEWKVVVDDGIGHRLEVMTPVNETKRLKTDEHAGESSGISLSRYERAIMGLCIIFGISGWFLWWKGYKNTE
ncbi:MAG: hypothetical protein SV375_21080, partial [Thermodesulfobacteriota bacterium]|nr:hypothetical protein [Thermodesulfobacteriota bacterium]